MIERKRSGKMRKYCVIGYPIGHSKSPGLFERFSGEKGYVFGRDVDYVRNEIADIDQFNAFIKELRAGLWDGCNVTMPWKTEMFKSVDELSETARLTGSVNTVSAVKGHLYGDSTDGCGMLNPVEAELTNTGKLNGLNMVILGCGGAARSIIAEAMLRKMNRISVVCRETNSKNVDLTLAMLKKIKDCTTEIDLVQQDNIEELSHAIANADLLVNSTPVGMADGTGNENRLPLNDEIVFPKKLIVADCVYNPDETLLIKKAKDEGCRTVKGIRMLEEQARCGVKVLLQTE